MQRLLKRLAEVRPAWRPGDAYGFGWLASALRSAGLERDGFAQEPTAGLITEFEKVLTDALKEEAPPGLAAPAARLDGGGPKRAGGKTSDEPDEQEWRKFERELEQDLIREFKL